MTPYQWWRIKTILLEMMVTDMLPHLPQPHRDRFALRLGGIDNATRVFYDRGKVNKPDNETKSAAVVPTKPELNQGEGLSMPDEEE